jgi:hypothetical protein
MPLTFENNFGKFYQVVLAIMRQVGEHFSARGTFNRR